MTTRNAGTLNRNLTTEIAAAQKTADAAKKAAKATKAALKDAKRDHKEARRLAKQAKKIVKQLRAELAVAEEGKRTPAKRTTPVKKSPAPVVVPPSASSGQPAAN